jgi:FtsZ-binding cell division protein ZapB
MIEFQKQELQDLSGKPFAIVIPIKEYEQLIEEIEDKEDIISILQFEINKLKGEPLNLVDLKWESSHNTHNE